MFIRKLIQLQERRKYRLYTVLVFVIFVGIGRGLEESILFRTPLRNSEILTFLPFYFSIAFLLTLVLSKIVAQPFQKVVNPVLVGVFLGLFPPAVDFFFNSSSNIFYGYYFLQNFSELPYLGYKPEFNFPLGEAVIIWASVIFCGIYVWVKTSSVLRSFLALLGGYIVFLWQGSFLPMCVGYFYLGEISTIAQARDLDETTLKIFLYYIAFWQCFSAIVVYFILRLELLRLFFKRILHLLPFKIAVFCGSAFAGAFEAKTALAMGLIGLVAFIASLHNHFYDRHAKVVQAEDIHFFNVIFIMAAVFLFFTGNRFVLPIIIAFALSFLYHYPFYRGKKVFPANLKIEGVWGMCSFLAGLLAVGSVETLPDNTYLYILFTLGGFSLIAALKDMKDIRSDFRAHVSTLFIFCYKKGVRLSKVRNILYLLALGSFLIPIAYLLTFSYWLEALILTLPILTAIILLRQGSSKAQWFQKFLFLTNTYLLFLGFLFYFEQWP